MTHPLDRPVWHALAIRQAPFSRGTSLARRFDPEIAPLAAAADGSPEALAALTALVPADDRLWLLEPGEAPALRGTIVMGRAPCVQMVAGRDSPALPGFAFAPLGEADAAEMYALAKLTVPGPFLARTHLFGGFVGVRHEGQLVAMAGERMKLPGFTEVSGVCTHPDHRGRGYAAGLVKVVMAGIVARGEQPFLHSYAANAGAIALYETLGFATRATLIKTEIARR